MKALMIVAHPDDEVIWAGGLILKNPDWSWTIISLCRADDPDRAPKFEKACKILNSKPIIADLDDESGEPLKQTIIKEKILSEIQGKKFDKVFTHGKNGEYGHIRHLDIHKAVTSLFKNKRLAAKELWYFDYVHGKEKSGHDNKTIIPIPNKNGDLIVELTNKEHKKKLSIVTDIYGYVPPIIETQACAKQEAFKQHKK